MAAVRTYRHALRELMKSGAPRRGTLKKVPAATLRGLFDSHRSADSTDAAVLLRTVDEAILFLKNQREHQELLTRYNPFRELTSEQHIKATANRVGLDMPVECKPTEGQ